MTNRAPEKDTNEKNKSVGKLSSLNNKGNVSGRVNRYSKEIYADGPCLLSNETLEMLVRTMFKRSYLTSEELSIEIEESERGAKTIQDLALGSSDEDDFSDDSMAFSEKSFSMKHETEEKSNGMEEEAEATDKNRNVLEMKDESESDSDVADGDGSRVSFTATEKEPSERPLSKPSSQGTLRTSTPA